MSEVTEDCLSNASNEADQTTVNRHTNRMLQLALQLALFKVSVRTQSLTYNVCYHHSVCIHSAYYYYQIFTQKYYIRKIAKDAGFQQSMSCSNTNKYIKIPIYT